MKNIILFLLVSCTAAFSQNAVVEIPLTLTDAAGDSTTLWFGLDSAASDGIDVSLGEDELPPFPPKKVFEARFVGDDIDLPQLGLGSYKDLRKGDELFSGVVRHEIRYQTFNNAKLTLAWDLPDNVSAHLVDLYGGTYLDKSMSGKGEVSISLVTVVDRILMTVNYQAPSLTIKAPNGGEVLRIYDEAVLEWDSRFVEGDVLLSLSRDNGAVYDTLARTANSGSYVWSVDGPPGDECLLKVADSTGRIVDYSDAPFSIKFVAGVKSDVAPTDFYLSPNYPNPFNPETTIRFFTPQSAFVRVDIVNALGRLVRRLSEKMYAPGWQSIVWNGQDDLQRRVAGGVYFCRVTAGDELRIAKMILAP